MSRVPPHPVELRIFVDVSDAGIELLSKCLWASGALKARVVNVSSSAYMCVVRWDGHLKGGGGT